MGNIFKKFKINTENEVQVAQKTTQLLKDAETIQETAHELIASPSSEESRGRERKRQKRPGRKRERELSISLSRKHINPRRATRGESVPERKRKKEE